MGNRKEKEKRKKEKKKKKKRKKREKGLTLIDKIRPMSIYLQLIHMK